MNVFSFSGNLGRDAELRNTQSGTAVLSFAVPVKSGYGEREQTNWIDCAMFGKRAEGRLVEFLKKGTPVCVTGEASLNTFTKGDGSAGAKISVNVQDVTLMGKKEQPVQAQPVPTSDPAPADSDIPF